MVTHRDIVTVIAEVHVRDRQTKLVLLGRVQGNTVGFLRHIFTDQPHTCHVVVRIHRVREITAPITWVQEGCHERYAERQRFHFIATDETTLRIKTRFVLDDARHRGTAEHVHWLFEDAIHRCGHVTHVVSTDLTRRVRHAIREHAGRRVQQQTRRLNRVTRHANHFRFLEEAVAFRVTIQHASRTTLGIMLNLQYLCTRTYLEVAG